MTSQLTTDGLDEADLKDVVHNERETDERMLILSAVALRLLMDMDDEETDKKIASNLQQIDQDEIFRTPEKDVSKRTSLKGRSIPLVRREENSEVETTPEVVVSSKKNLDSKCLKRKSVTKQNPQSTLEENVTQKEPEPKKSCLKRRNKEAEVPISRAPSAASRRSDANSTVYSICSRLSAKSSRGKRATEVLSAWQDMIKIQEDWMRKMTLEDVRRSEVTSFMFSSWSTMTKAFSKTQQRSSEIHEGMLVYLSRSVKFYEYMMLRQLEDIAKLPHEFVYSTLAKFLKSATYMSNENVGWHQTREAIEGIAFVTCNRDTVLSILSVIVTTQKEFLTHWLHEKERNEDFLCYAAAQLHQIQGVYTNRLKQCRTVEVYKLPH